MGRILLGVFILIFVGCKNFKTKKVSSDELVVKELRQINWKDVENYPSFPACENLVEKKAQQDCFEKNMTRYLYKGLQTQQAFVVDSIDQKLWMRISISATGKPAIDSLNIPMELKTQLPKLAQWLHEAVDSLPKIYPAQKRGIPVATSFKMPLHIQSY